METGAYLTFLIFIALLAPVLAYPLTTLFVEIEIKLYQRKGK